MADAPQPVLVYNRIAGNRRRTRRLLGLFVLFLLPFVAGLVVLFIIPLGLSVLLRLFGERGLEDLLRTAPGWCLALAATVGVTTVLVVGLAAWLATVLSHVEGSTGATPGVIGWLQLAQAPRLVLRMTGARPMLRFEEPDLSRSVENLCIGAGLPRPWIYIIESSAPNAFATGLDVDDAALVFTRGLLTLLNRRELEGVIGHEISHIGNQDIRLSTVLAAILGVLRLPRRLFSRFVQAFHPVCIVAHLFLVLSGAVWLLALSGVLIWVLEGFHSPVSGSRFAAFSVVLVVGLPFYVLVGAQACGFWVRRSVSRQREFLADADSVLLTRDPEGLALALVKIDAATDASNEADAATAHLYVVDPRESVEERVALLAHMGSGIAPGTLRAAKEAGLAFLRTRCPDRNRPRTIQRTVSRMPPPPVPGRR